MRPKSSKAGPGLQCNRLDPPILYRLDTRGAIHVHAFSGADLLLAMLMRWSRKMPHPATEWPALDALAVLVRGRASWKRLYEMEGLTEW